MTTRGPKPALCRRCVCMSTTNVTRTVALRPNIILQLHFFVPAGSGSCHNGVGSYIVRKQKKTRRLSLWVTIYKLAMPGSSETRASLKMSEQR